MAPMKQTEYNHHSSNYGEDIDRQVNILASCYVVDSRTADLKGFHYCTTDLAGAECPPLAALTATNELALAPKTSAKRNSNGSLGGNSNVTNGRGSGAVGGTSIDLDAWHRRRGGAALRIREECERFFCETLRAVFLGERNSAPQISSLTGAHNNGNHANRNRVVINNSSERLTARVNGSGVTNGSSVTNNRNDRSHVSCWLEIWDYSGGSSFRGFVGEDPQSSARTLFIFLDSQRPRRDFKQALVALIELGEGPLACSYGVICVERSTPDEERDSLINGLQWAGFSLSTLDLWSNGPDKISKRWLFLTTEL